MQGDVRTLKCETLGTENARDINGLSTVTKGLVGRHKAFVREESLPWLPLLRRSIVKSSKMETERKGSYNETEQQSKRKGVDLVRQ